MMPIDPVIQTPRAVALVMALVIEINLVWSSAVLINAGVCFCVVGPAGVPGTGPAEIMPCKCCRWWL